MPKCEVWVVGLQVIFILIFSTILNMYYLYEEI